MSLFGTSPIDDPISNPISKSNSLFGDNITPAARSTSSLFADDNVDGSPWSMPTPKKNARRVLVKELLPATDVPESYVDAYDTMLNFAVEIGAGVDITGVRNLLGSSGLNAAEQAKILDFVIPEGQEDASGLGRNEFNVLLALIGLGQEGEDITLDSVDERRQKLPIPRLSYLDTLKSQSIPEQSTPQASTRPTEATPKPPDPFQPRNPRRDSLDPEVDPWGSPAAPKATVPPESRKTVVNGVADHISNNLNGLHGRTTSNFTTHGESPAQTPIAPSSNPPTSSGSDGWRAYNGNSDGFPDQPPLGGGFGSGGDDSNPGGEPPRSLGGSTVLPRGVEETVTVTMLPEKEGMFMFQHRNYEVKTVRRNSTVVRRYSDFVWLLDCLHKRYPFRLLPLLPPKRVAVNGTHLAADTPTFLEKRRRGLVRFANALVRHPVLSQEQLVIMFLTVPTELSVWRKQATISVQEEFVGKVLPPTLEESLPSNLTELFDTVRTGVRRASDIYINLCNLMERLAKRNEGLAADHLRFSLALQSLTETSRSTYYVDTNDVPLLNEGVSATAKHLSSSQTLLEDEAKAWDQGVLEDLKRQRDVMVGMRDVFDRRDRYARDNIPQLERRIENNEQKLINLRNKPEAVVKPGEIEKVENSIINDKESIVQQHARGVLIKECIRDEILDFNGRSIAEQGRLWQDWAGERVKFAELLASNWRGLAEEVESMPTGEE